MVPMLSLSSHHRQNLYQRSVKDQYQNHHYTISAAVPSFHSYCYVLPLYHTVSFIHLSDQYLLCADPFAPLSSLVFVICFPHCIIYCNQWLL